jgi:hypothetical protein
MIRHRIGIKKRERTMETDATYRGTVYPRQCEVRSRLVDIRETAEKHLEPAMA